MRAALDYIGTIWGIRICRFQTVADQVGISRNYFSRIFEEVMSVNFIDYVTRLRVGEGQKPVYEHGHENL